MFFDNRSKEALRLRPCFLPIRRLAFLPSQSVNPRRLPLLTGSVIRQRLFGSRSANTGFRIGIARSAVLDRGSSGREAEGFPDCEQRERHPCRNQEWDLTIS